MCSKKIYGILLSIILFSNVVFAQRPKVEYGKISIEDVKKSKYDIDSTTDAVVLYEKATTKISQDDSRGFYYETELFIRKKILKASALSQGTIEIDYVKGANDNSQSIEGIKASSYVIENGVIKKSELGKKEIYDEKTRGKNYMKKFTIPNVKEGAVIEYTYTKFTPFKVDNTPSTWYFQGSNPTLWSEYEITVPEWIYYQITMGGYLPLAYNKSEPVSIDADATKLSTIGTKYTFAIANAPAFKNENFISSITDYISKVGFELSSVNIPGQIGQNFSVTWADLNKTLLESENFGVRLKRSNYLKETIAKFDAINDKKEKLEKVYYYMNHYLDLDQNYGSIFVGDLKKAFENKKGNPNEQNLIFTAMLREMDYEANPVILSTRDNGKINQNYALMDKFNYTICRVKVDTTYYNLDISDRHLKMGMLPDICLNGDGREVNKAGGQFISLKPFEKIRTYQKADAKFDLKTGKLLGKYEENSNGYVAYAYKKEFKEIGKEKFEEKIKKETNEANISNIILLNLEESDKSVGIKYNFALNEEFSGDEDILYVNPMIQGKVSENPFKLEERLYPIDFGAASDVTYVLNLDVPQGYKVESMPKGTSTVLKDKSGQFAYNCTFDEGNNKISVVSRINFKNTMYFTEQYQEIKELYNRIVQKHNEQIVLKKK
jgi:Domain of Unknown Function with PDB structure (DUF3857)